MTMFTFGPAKDDRHGELILCDRCDGTGKQEAAASGGDGFGEKP